MNIQSHKRSTAVLATFAACSMLWLAPAPTHAASPPTYTWDHGANNTDWHTALNWDTDNVPTASKNVVITDKSVSIAGGNTGEADTITFTTSAGFADFGIHDSSTLNANALIIKNTRNNASPSYALFQIRNNSTVNIANDLTFLSDTNNVNQEVRLLTTTVDTHTNALTIGGSFLLNSGKGFIESNNLNLTAHNIISDGDTAAQTFNLSGNAKINLDNNADPNINTSVIRMSKDVDNVTFNISDNATINVGSINMQGDGTTNNTTTFNFANTSTDAINAVHGIKVDSKNINITLDNSNIKAGDDGISIGYDTNTKANASSISTFNMTNGSQIVTTGDFECFGKGTLNLNDGTIKAANINKYAYESGVSHNPGQFLTINMTDGSLIATGSVTDGSASDAIIQFQKEMSTDRYDQLVGYGTVTAGYTDGDGFHAGTIKINNYAGIKNNVNGETLTFNGNINVTGIENLDTDPANDRYHPYSLYATNGGNIVINGNVGYQGVYVADAGSSITINGDLTTETTTINGNVIVNGNILVGYMGSKLTVKNNFNLNNNTTLNFDLHRLTDAHRVTFGNMTLEQATGKVILADGAVMTLGGNLRITDVTRAETQKAIDANFPGITEAYDAQFAAGDVYTLIKAGDDGNGTGSLEGSLTNIYLPTETNGVMLEIDLNTADDDGIPDYLKLIAKAAGISPTVAPTSEGMKKTMSAIDEAAKNNAAFNTVVTDILNLPTKQKQQAAVQSLQQNNVQSIASTSSTLASSNASAMHSRFSAVSQGQLFAFNPTSNQPNQQLADAAQEPTDYMLMLSTESNNELTGSPVFDWFNRHNGGIFLTSSFTHTDHDSTANQVGFESYQSDFLIGSDFMATENLRLGAAIGYAYVTTDNLNSLGSSETNALNTQLYANYYASPNLRIDLTAGYTYADYQLERNLFSGKTAFGNTHNHQFTAEAGINYLMPTTPVKNLVLTPFAYLRYVNSNIAGYTETKAGHLGLKVDSQSSDSLTSSLGATASFKYELSNSVLEPFISASYEHQFIDQDRSSTVSFIGDPSNPFKAFVDGTDENYVNLSIGSLWAVSDKLMFRATFDTALFHDELESQRLSAGFRFNF